MSLVFRQDPKSDLDEFDLQGVERGGYSHWHFTNYYKQNNMDFKTVSELVGKHLASSIIVILVLGVGGGHFIWNEYKELLKQKNLLSQEFNKFHSEKSEFQKYRLEVTAAMQERKMELDKREFILSQLEQKNLNEIAAIQQRANEYRAAFSKLQIQQKNVSNAERIKNAEEKIQKLMSEFSSLGIDLNSTLKCNDSEAKSKFDVAKSKYYEMVAISQSYGLYDSYKQFFFHNAPSSWHACTQ